MINHFSGECPGSLISRLGALEWPQTMSASSEDSHHLESPGRECPGRLISRLGALEWPLRFFSEDTSKIKFGMYVNHNSQFTIQQLSATI